MLLRIEPAETLTGVSPSDKHPSKAIQGRFLPFLSQSNHFWSIGYSARAHYSAHVGLFPLMAPRGEKREGVCLSVWHKF